MAMQTEKLPLSRTQPSNGSKTAKAVFAAGALLSAFGVASCCALPVALSLLGISAASLVGIGYLAGQYQRELFYAAAACLGVASLLTLRQRRARMCASGVASPGSALDWGSKLAMILSLGLLALTFWIESPL
jgi:mercuric ion transport protein